MKNKIKWFMVCIMIIMLGSLGFIAYYAKQKTISGAVLIIPSQPNGGVTDTKKMEEKNGDGFLLTYESTENGTVNVLNKNQAVVLKGTNYLYPSIVNKPIVSGSFFSKADQTENRRVAVLNKKAAFDIFGNYDIANTDIEMSNEIFTIAGVINDLDKENPNVYIPFAHTKKTIDSFASQIESNSQAAEAELKGKLKPFNINDNAYDFYNMNVFIQSLYIRFTVGIKIFLLMVLLYILNKCYKVAKRRIIQLQGLHIEYDLGDLVKLYPFSFVHVAIFLASASATLLAILSIIINTIEDLLLLWDSQTVILTDYSSGFSNTIHMANNLSWYSRGIFIGYILFSILFVVVSMLLNDQKKQTTSSLEKE